MNDFQEFSGEPRYPLNGHRTTADILPDSTLAWSWQESTDRETTRYLSAATQISLKYADTVVSRVMNEPFRALAPTFGADVPVVAKWALKAIRTRALRNYILAGIFIAILAVPALLFLWLQTLIMLPILVIVAWLTVSWEDWERIHNIVAGKMLRDRFIPEEAPDPPKESDCERLADVGKRREGNLVVFSGHSAFIGSGRKLYYQHVLIDVSRGKQGEDGTPLGPDEFTSHDLHEAILEAFGHEKGLAKSLTSIKVYQRLFVNGLHVQNDPHFLPDPLKPPPTSVDSYLLETATQCPTPDARTYVCVEMPGWQGQLVVTLFIRAVHTGRSLYIDWTFRVLPPLEERFLVIDRHYEASPLRQVRNSLRHGARRALPELLRSPLEAWRAGYRPYAARRHQARQSHAIENGYVFDYGAQKSIREDACGAQRQHYFLARDESMYVLLAQQTLTRAVEIFLDKHNVDLGDYKAQVKVIFDNSIKVGNITNSNGVTIGDNSSSSVNDSPKETR